MYTHIESNISGKIHKKRVPIKETRGLWANVYFFSDI